MEGRTDRSSICLGDDEHHLSMGRPVSIDKPIPSR
jgi:hypothetical protein